MTTDTEALRQKFERHIVATGRSDGELIFEAGHYLYPDVQEIWELYQAGHADAKVDNERLLAANLDCIDHFEAMKDDLAEAQRDSERLDWMIEQRAYVVSDPDCCDGYWLNYLRPDGTLWTQATEHETPRAAIDAAKGESNG